MYTFLIIVAAVMLGGVLSVFILWFGIKFLIRHFLKKLLTALEKLAGGQSVPPFRISLDKSDTLKWKHPTVVDGIAAALEGAGYTRIGDYRMSEMPTARLRALLHAATNCYAVVTEFGDAKPLLDIACDYADGDHFTVSTAPETGLDRPEWSRLERMTVDLAANPADAVSLHERMAAHQSGRSTTPATADGFTDRFTAYHAREMDWRIARGGVTPEEVRRSCEVTGAEPPTDEAVEMVCASWRRAISEFVDERLRAKFTNYLMRMSAAEWEQIHDRIYIVHEHSDRDVVITALANRFDGLPGYEVPDIDDDDDDDESETNGDASTPALGKLRPLFATATVRDGFIQAQELLPAERRYRRITRINRPYLADVYVAPTTNGE